MAGESHSAVLPQKHKIDVHDDSAPPPQKRKIDPNADPHPENEMEEEADLSDSSSSPLSETELREPKIYSSPQYIYADDYDPDEDDSGEPRYAPEFQDEEVRRKYIDYHKKMEATEGFDIVWEDVKDIPDTHRAIHPITAECWDGYRDWVEEMAVDAIRQYKREQGRNMEFLKVENACLGVDIGFKFYITFLAAEPGGEAKVFQALTRKLNRTNKGVYFCRLKS